MRNYTVSEINKMPCNCIVDKPLYPQNEEWGPLLWWMLHTLSEKSGKQLNPITMGDEQRAWPLFLKTLVPIIPCPYCREHLQEYIVQNPFQPPSDYYEWNTYIRTYFYTLHESVNTRLAKPSYPFENLSVVYSDIRPFTNTLQQLETVQKRAIQMGGVSLLAWKAWLKQLGMLRAAIF